MVVPIEERFWAKVDKSADCWVWKGATVQGYGILHVTGKRSVYAHRFSYELAFGPIPPLVAVCNTCENKLCVRPDHLVVGNPSRVKRHLAAKGQRHPNSKLTEQYVRDILGRPDEPGTVLAREFGVSPATICAIRHGRVWAHLTTHPLPAPTQPGSPA